VEELLTITKKEFQEYFEGLFFAPNGANRLEMHYNSKALHSKLTDPDYKPKDKKQEGGGEGDDESMEEDGEDEFDEEKKDDEQVKEADMGPEPVVTYDT
jgi:hypothetical protein